jgi:hypothetical protein
MLYVPPNQFSLMWPLVKEYELWGILFCSFLRISLTFSLLRARFFFVIRPQTLSVWIANILALKVYHILEWINYEWSVRCSIAYLRCAVENITTLRRHNEVRNIKYSSLRLFICLPTVLNKTNQCLVKQYFIPIQVFKRWLICKIWMMLIILRF